MMYRLARVALHVLWGMAQCAVLFPWLGRRGRSRATRRWSAGLMAICGVRVVFELGAHGALAHAMVVSNHVSWLDIFVINAVHPCRFVAKAEIRAWPMLGWLATKAGTVFIARGDRRDLRHIFKGLVDKLQDGERIAFFPEGTTAAQGQLLPFHPNLFEAAIDAAVPVQPFALSYRGADGQPHPGVEFTGETTFGASLAAILKGGPVTATVICLAPLASAGAHRRELALAARAAVAGALGVG